MKIQILIFLILSMVLQSAYANKSCVKILDTQSYKNAAQFLHQKNPKLHMSSYVMLNMSRNEKALKPIVKIEKWIKHLEKHHTGLKPGTKNYKKLIKFYSKKYVISEQDIPETFYSYHEKIAREQHRGNIILSDEQRKMLSMSVINQQKYSLDIWLKYFLSEDTNIYPMWLKYWAFESIVKIGSLDLEKGAIRKRSISTTAPFIELDSLRN